MQGLIPPTCNGRLKFLTRLACNLNSGDSIYLVLRSIDVMTNAPAFSYQLNFAICY